MSRQELETAVDALRLGTLLPAAEANMRAALKRKLEDRLLRDLDDSRKPRDAE